MSDPQLSKAKASFFRAIGEETRLSILEELRKNGEMNVSNIVKRLERNQSRISHHLACLRNCGLVTTRREGKQVFYSLNGEERIAALLDNVDEHVKAVLTGILSCEVVKEE